MVIKPWELPPDLDLPVGKPLRWAPTMEDLFGVFSPGALFQGRWKFSKKGLKPQEYAKLVEMHAEPALARLLTIHQQEGLFFPRCALVWIPCRKDGDSLLLNPDDPGKSCRWTFPRRKGKPHLCLADYFPDTAATATSSSASVSAPFASSSASSSSASDATATATDATTLIPLWAATLGQRAVEVGRCWFDAGRFQDYHFLHGLAAELTDCCAALAWIRAGLSAGLGSAAKPAGLRYSFGYPSCPDLAFQRDLLRLVDGARLGITLTENDMMVPEFSVSGFVILHPQARYFAV